MTTASSHSRRVKRWALAIGVPILVLIVVGGSLWVSPQEGTAGAGDEMTFTVRRGPLTISVTESGTIKAREQEILKNELEGQTTIIYLIPEGTLVKEGELLVELDASDLQDEKVDQQIQMQNAEAAYIRAREDLEVAKSQAKSDIAKAELDYKFAQEDVTQYVDGQFPTLLKEAEANITLAKEEFERASEKLKWSERLYEEKYLSQTELEADRLTQKRAELNHELAIVSHDLLKEFTYQRQLDQLNSDVDQTQMALDRVRRKADADIVQAEAELKAKELEFKQQEGKLKKVEEQIGKTRVVAPINGMVIYATSARGSYRGSSEPLDEGQSVREREELIYLPTADAMMAEVKVHESNLDKVRPGLRVRVTVDARPGEAFSGEVATIAPLPDPQSMWLNPDLKIFSTQIHLDGSGQRLRTGMTCRVEIIVTHYEDVMYVPIQSVLRIGDQPSVYVIRGGRIEPRAIQIGLDNNRMVHVVSGLEPGEEVLLNPPLAPSEAPAGRPPASPAPESQIPSASGSEAKPSGQGADAQAGRPGESSEGQAGPAPRRPEGQGGSSGRPPGGGQAPQSRDREGADETRSRPAGGREGGPRRSDGTRSGGQRERSERPGGSS